MISTNCLDRNINCNIDTTTNAIKIIRDDILSKFQVLVELNWPPSSEEHSSDARKPPESVYKFLNAFMKFDDHHVRLSSKSARVVESYAQDFVHGVTRGKVMQKKHFLLAVGLPNLTGTRKIFDIFHKLGHCISYNLTCEIEAAQAECAVKASQESNLLPLKPESNEKTVFTHY